ncbi:hypothetical protein EDC94DRAFT_675027 [Helicostylum pulchrum]|nr:hypothetical protein EDC94DRAFT_675027 [Helicostylum pulchrum]
MLLKRLFGTEDVLRNMIYENNLVQKNDGSKKLRIATHGEGLFHVIQQSFNLQFTLKSFFVVAQLYADYILNENLTKQKTETTKLFGKYKNIQYVFHLIHFNYNPQFQYIFMKILKDETDHFLYEEKIDIAHYSIPKLSNRLLRPVLQQEPFSYKAFQVGVLYHVYSENYGFGFNSQSYKFKNKISDSIITAIDIETVFPPF